MGQTMRFNIHISEFEKINPLFSKAKIYVLYTGMNRNNSYISKESVEKAIPSIFNIPIVGEYLQESENFGGHGGKLEVNDDGIKYVQTTKPYGVVSESANIYWETVTENDGKVNEYLVVDGAYLWSGRYEEINDIVSNQYGQSMEIEIQDGKFAVIDGQETYQIDSFLFSALCILGINKDGTGHVEPCFESASINAYSLNKEEFIDQFNQMVAELKFSLSKGGNNVSEEKVDTVEETVEEVKFEENQLTEVKPEIQIDQIETSPEETEVIEITEPETDYKLEYEVLKANLDKLTSDYAELETEVKSLREFKEVKSMEERMEKETDLFNSFSSELTDEDMQGLKDKASEFSLEQLEEKLYVMVGKKKATFSKQPKKEKQTSIKIELEHKVEEPTVYGGLFEKFSK